MLAAEALDRGERDPTRSPVQIDDGAVGALLPEDPLKALPALAVDENEFVSQSRANAGPFPGIGLEKSELRHRGFRKDS